MFRRIEKFIRRTFAINAWIFCVCCVKSQKQSKHFFVACKKILNLKSFFRKRNCFNLRKLFKWLGEAYFHRFIIFFNIIKNPQSKISINKRRIIAIIISFDGLNCLKMRWYLMLLVGNCLLNFELVQYLVLDDVDNVEYSFLTVLGLLAVEKDM